MGTILMLTSIVGIDPALKNFGIAQMTLDTTTMKFKVDGLHLITTEKRANKVVRVNSDDLRRAQELYRDFVRLVSCFSVGFAEIPSGGQSARAVHGFGIAIGILAACPIPLIQVQAYETKLFTVGTKTASKEEMIEWATETYPDAPWIRHKHKGQLVLSNANEHLADAVAVAHAGIKTDQFQQLMAMWKQAA